MQIQKQIQNTNANINKKYKCKYKYKIQIQIQKPIRKHQNGFFCRSSCSAVLRCMMHTSFFKYKYKHNYKIQNTNTNATKLFRGSCSARNVLRCMLPLPSQLQPFPQGTFRLTKTCQHLPCINYTVIQLSLSNYPIVRSLSNYLGWSKIATIAVCYLIIIFQ